MGAVSEATAEVSVPGKPSDRYCIVGAGPAGLAQARAFKAAGLAFDLFERHGDVGGIWDIENSGTPMYKTAHFVSSKSLSGFFDFPLPADDPDYPSHVQVLAYLREFARAYGLDAHITFGTAVDWAEPEEDGWRVTLAGGERRRYRALVCANGMSWHPAMPEIPGRFDGEMRHAVSYRKPEEFKGRRVLILGAGNSGCDIACDAAQHAEAAFLSLRRGYHFIPKHVFGMPADVFGARGPRLPLAVRQRMLGILLRLLTGDLRRYGLPKPDHRIFESHPIINSLVLHHLSHGDLEAKPDIRELRGRTVVFQDGSEEAVDLILLATGYHMTIPFMERSHFDWAGTRLNGYLSVFTKYDSLFTLGFLATDAGVFGDFDRLAHLVTRFLLDQAHDPDRAARFRAKIDGPRPDLSGGIRFVESVRHANYLHNWALRNYLEKLRRDMSWPALDPARFVALRHAAEKAADDQDRQDTVAAPAA